MVVDRRRFLLASSSAALCMPGSVSLASAPRKRLEPRPGKAVLLEHGGPEATIWGFDGRVPGPTLRVRRGDELAVRLVNGIEHDTSIHWHGIRIDNAMDGVAPLTQAPVEPGKTFDYRFRALDAGTFWYHPHTHHSYEQVARGLYGVLIVEEDDPPDIDHDLLFVADDWRLTEEGQIDEASFGNWHDASHAGRLGNVLTINGEPYGRYAVASGDRVRLRCLSTATARVMSFAVETIQPSAIAIDGQPIKSRLVPDRTFTLAPGQRIDIVLDFDIAAGSTVRVFEVSNTPFVAAEFMVGEGNRDRVESRAEIRLADNPLPEKPERADRTVDLVMEGGAMRFLTSAEFQGDELDGQTLARSHGQFWALNGVAGMPDDPLFRAAGGEVMGTRIVNRTAFPHAMHVHGHHFVELARSDGPADRDWRDTVLLAPDTEVTIAFPADNPGKWMFHCHMLEHQASGMMTWFEVTA